MEIVNELSYRIGENCILVIAEDASGAWWHCLSWKTEETDFVGPFATQYEALLDAQSTYLDPLWSEMGWNVNSQLLDAVA